MASSNDAALGNLSKAVTQATPRSRRLRRPSAEPDGHDAAAKLVSDITSQQTQLNTQITTVKAAMAKLTTTQQASLSSGASNAARSSARPVC